MTNDNERAMVNMAQAVKTMLDNWPHHLELIRFQAKVARARYEALRQAGFSAGEALGMCTRPVEL